MFILSFLTLYSITTKSFISSNRKIRFFAEDGLENLCKKNKDLYNYYYKNEDYKISKKDFGKLNSNSQIILDFLSADNKSKYILEYSLSCKKYVLFFILLLIIIILTISYSFTSCVECCLKCCIDECFNFFSCSCCKNERFKNIICKLIPFIYFLVFFLSLLVLLYTLNIIEKFSGATCVLLQFVDTFIEGDIRNVYPKWAGIFIVSDILEKIGNITSKNNQNLMDNINNNKKIYLEKSKEWNNYLNESEKKITQKYFTINDTKMSLTDVEKEKNITPFYVYEWSTILEKINNTAEEDAEKIKNVIYILEKYYYSLLGCDSKGIEIKCTENSTISQLFNNGAKIIKSLREPMLDIKTKISNPFKDFFDLVENEIISIFLFVIIFVILYCIIIETLLLIFYYTKKCKFIKSCLTWILCFIYYASIIIVILGFIVGIVIGLIGSFFKDLTNVIQYIISTENLKSEEPKMFGKNIYIKYLDVCLNGDGNLGKEFGLTNSFYSIDNITDITNTTEDLINETLIETSDKIDYYINNLKELNENLNEKYLNIEYYDIDNGSIFNIRERIKEINNYVSGAYSNNKNEICLINENWNTKKMEEGYIYDESYPDPDINNHYLIYLYDKDVYKKARLETRYENSCLTDGYPYKTMSEASQKFGILFKDIGDKILSDNYIDECLNDLTELNKLFGQKNYYLRQSLNYAYKGMKDIVKTFIQYISENDNMFSLLNCKFVGNNKLIMMNILYTSLGTYIESIGILTIMFSLSIFIGIVFILIIIKNSKLDKKEDFQNDINALSNILKGNENETRNQNIIDIEKNLELIKK